MFDWLTQQGQRPELLWYFTDEREPALQIHKTFAMQPVREAWVPHGVVPAEHFTISFAIDYEDPKIGVQSATFEIHPTNSILGRRIAMRR